MFVLRLSVVLVIFTTVGIDAEAQLFRFRANPAFSGRSNANQQQGYPSTYDARAYQYTRVQPQTNYVPSQRTLAQGQTPACNCQQQNLVPANSVAALQQQIQRPQQLQIQRPQQQAVMQTQVVAVTYRDPNSGRLFQRRYLVQQPRTPQSMAQQQSNIGSTVQQGLAAANQAALTQTPRQTLFQANQANQANPIGVTSPNINGGVATTSLETPILELTDNSSAEFSVFGTEEGAGTETKSVLESSLPVLEAPADESEIPGALLDTDGSLDLDLPPLELEDSQ